MSCQDIRSWSALMGISLGCLLVSVGVALTTVDAKVEILPGTTLEADEDTVKAILATFERAEEALKARDIDGIMAIYSESYNYHGLRKSDMRRIWESLFANHRDLSTTHLFSRIVITGPTRSPIAEVTCNGVLLARSDITVGKTRSTVGTAKSIILPRRTGRGVFAATRENGRRPCSSGQHPIRSSKTTLSEKR